MGRRKGRREIWREEKGEKRKGGQMKEGESKGKNAKRTKNLDQETWLCRTHLDSFFRQFWTIISDRFGHTLTIMSS